MDILILGGGVAGLTSALALTKFAPDGQVPNIRIFEIRPEPATMGGAVNLTPNALRLLHHLGVLEVLQERGYGESVDAVEVFDIYSGKIAESSFRGPDGQGLGCPPYKALRISRGDTLRGMLEMVARHDNIRMECGKRTISIEEREDDVSLVFHDGTTATGHILLGCDGIHSAARLQHVEPERQATYSGITNAFGFAPIGNDQALHFECSAINLGRRGLLLTSYHEPSHRSVYVGALMQLPEIRSREGWKAAQRDEGQIRADIKTRFGDAVIPCIAPLIDSATDFEMWPVFTLTKGGRWATERSMLLGDAAHAMPPQGEATGIVLEDTVLFARCLMRWVEKGRAGKVKCAFDAYERLRRHRIDLAFDESSAVVATVTDAGWLAHKIKTLVIPYFLWRTRADRERHFVEVVTTCSLGF